MNPSKYLKEIVPIGATFYIGFGIKNLTDIAKKDSDITDLVAQRKSSVIVTGKKGVLKENTKGKLVRKQPERKEDIWKHIHYYSKRFEKDIDYDREFHIWEREVLHKYNLALEIAVTPQGETILHFPAFKMADDDATYMKAGAAMNLAIALGSYFLPYNHKFEPFIPVTKLESRRILPPGNFTVYEKLEIIKKDLITNGDGILSEGNSYRFALLNEKKPSDVTMGVGGFNEYLMFEYFPDDLMVLENLKTGNATFLFTLSHFNKKADLNKQTAMTDPSFLKRIIHHNLEDWSRQFGSYFKNSK
ncbi:hypothetical protein GZH53_17365 [Flavihumibacter sp. R14]|nr:hypothetical protein [Flavihumibacter soli]